MDDLSEYIRATSVKLEKVVADDDLDALGVMMALFKTIRERESGISQEMRPIEEMYAMLERNLPSGFMDKSEVDKRTVLESGWRKMVSDSAWFPSISQLEVWEDGVHDATPPLHNRWGRASVYASREGAAAVSRRRRSTQVMPVNVSALQPNYTAPNYINDTVEVFRTSTVSFM